MQQSIATDRYLAPYNVFVVEDNIESNYQTKLNY